MIEVAAAGALAGITLGPLVLRRTRRVPTALLMAFTSRVTRLFQSTLVCAVAALAARHGVLPVWPFCAILLVCIVDLAFTWRRLALGSAFPHVCTMLLLALTVIPDAAGWAAARGWYPVGDPALLPSFLKRAAVPALGHALESKDAELRRRAVVGLGELGSAGSPGILRSLRDRSPEVRATAVELLDRLAPPGAVVRAVEALDDEAPEVRRVAVAVLGRQGWRADSVLRWVIRTPASTGSPVPPAVAPPHPELEPLHRRLGNRWDDVRLRAFTVLVQQRTHRNLRSCVLAAEDPNPRIRAAAVRCLAASSDLRVRPTIAAALGDSDPVVRAAAVRALNRTAPGMRPEAPQGRVRELIRRLDDSDAQVRVEAALVVRGMDAHAVPALARFVRENPDRCEPVVDILAQLQHPAGLAAIRAADALRDDHTRCALCEALIAGQGAGTTRTGERE